ncbi:hypothetical protein O3P69_018215 [Scylla paramamosain]|uniref:Uncharacterized protein n=1 Tax=Scylla paramamosain TaxID=85552 RepID=A0AAW0TLI3_SCYPA
MLTSTAPGSSYYGPDNEGLAAQDGVQRDAFMSPPSRYTRGSLQGTIAHGRSQRLVLGCTLLASQPLQPSRPQGTLQPSPPPQDSSSCNPV